MEKQKLSQLLQTVYEAISTKLKSEAQSTLDASLAEIRRQVDAIGNAVMSEKAVEPTPLPVVEAKPASE